ncbi:MULTISPECIES: hypothetical protein [unclassified Streptomyces]|uniref:hypothetical protein n=1 Tax=unclassified Streptomyces TaxID=2593676 RepID=UPI003D765D9A
MTLIAATLTWAAPGTAQAAPVPWGTDSAGYAFAADARSVPGATGTSDAVRLEAGTTYRSALTDGEKTYYALELDAESSAYVSVTAVPRAADPEPSVSDGIRVDVQNADGQGCSHDTATVGAARSPRPVTAWGGREIEPGKRLCQKAGTYYVVVQRANPKQPTGQPWDLELTTVSEPQPSSAQPTRAPETWDSATPAPPAGEAASRRGGAGFATATAVGEGAWRDDISPGQTLYYKLPVDWGRSPHATVELGSSDEDTGYLAAALDVTLYNPVRAEADTARTGYGGTQKAATLAPVPPVAYANRYALSERVSAMRFAGWYYVVVHLAAQVADRFGDGPYGMTLRVGLDGTAAEGPGYAGEPVPRGVFDVAAATADSGGAEGSGSGGAGGPTAGTAAGASGGDGDTMRALAVGGIGTGTALLLVLGVWTVTARRRAAAAQTRVSAQNPTA